MLKLKNFWKKLFSFEDNHIDQFCERSHKYFFPLRPHLVNITRNLINIIRIDFKDDRVMSMTLKSLQCLCLLFQGVRKTMQVDDLRKG